MVHVNTRDKSLTDCTTIKPGQLLVAHPLTKDRRFHQSVILVTENHKAGTIGIVMNRPSLVSVAEAIEAESDWNWPHDDTLYQGGPVNPRSLMAVHTGEWNSTNTLIVNDIVSITSDKFMLEKMSAGNLPRNYRFMIGLCGWAPSQLQKEFDQGTNWLTCDSDERILFEYSGTTQWDLAIDQCARYTMSQYF